jgi:hypothetical protein
MLVWLVPGPGQHFGVWKLYPAASHVVVGLRDSRRADPAHLTLHFFALVVQPSSSDQRLKFVFESDVEVGGGAGGDG